MIILNITLLFLIQSAPGTHSEGVDEHLKSVADHAWMLWTVFCIFSNDSFYSRLIKKAGSFKSIFMHSF